MILSRYVPREDRPVLLRKRIVTDSYGDPLESWDPPHRIALPSGSQVQEQRPARGTTGERDTSFKHISETERVLFIPGRKVLNEDDRVEWHGDSHRVYGDPVAHVGLGGTVYTSTRLVLIKGA